MPIQACQNRRCRQQVPVVLRGAVKGYRGIEVYAYLPHKRVLPLALAVYGSPDPAVEGENLQIERVVTAVHEDLHGQGLWVADCGLARREAYAMWCSLRVPFLVRQRGDRTIVASSGTPMILQDFVEHLYQRGAHEVGNQRIVLPQGLTKHPDGLKTRVSLVRGHDRE